MSPTRASSCELNAANSRDREGAGRPDHGGDPGERRRATPRSERSGQRIQTEFHENQREVVAERSHGKRALRKGLGVDTAADILWTLNHPGVYRSAGR